MTLRIRFWRAVRAAADHVSELASRLYVYANAQLLSDLDRELLKMQRNTRDNWKI